MATKNKVSTLLVRRAIESSDLTPAQKRALFVRIVPSAQENLRLKGEYIQRITDVLRRDGKCGVMLTKTGRIQVIGGASVKFSHFHFENEEIQKKAMENRFLKPEAAVFEEHSL